VWGECSACLTTHADPQPYTQLSNIG
jgi:hypothetical protein